MHFYKLIKGLFTVSIILQVLCFCIMLQKVNFIHPQCGYNALRLHYTDSDLEVALQSNEVERK